MQSLVDKINEDFKNSLGKDAGRRSVLSMIKSAFLNEAIAFKKKEEDLLDGEAVAVLKREAKKRREAIESYENAGRQEQAEKEKQELAVIEEYLPEELPDKKIKKIIKEKAEALDIKNREGLGRLMGAVMEEAGGQASGFRVKQLVEDYFNED